MEAVSAYNEQQRENCIRSPLDVLPVLQGRAQMLGQLFELLADCVAAADKIEGKRK